MHFCREAYAQIQRTLREKQTNQHNFRIKKIKKNNKSIKKSKKNEKKHIKYKHISEHNIELVISCTNNNQDNR